MSLEPKSPINAMAHLLPPAGITYPESDRFRNYLVRPPAHHQQRRKVIVCCEVPRRQGPGCRADVRCQINDGCKTAAVKACPDCSDVITGFCRENDCRPRTPLTQPGLLCYSGCEDRCPAPKPCRSFYERRPPCSTRPCPKTSRVRPCSAGPTGPRLVKESHVSHCYTYQY